MQVQSDNIISQLFIEQDIEVLEETSSSDGTFTLKVKSSDILKTFELLKNKADFYLLLFVCGTDFNDFIELNYQLLSLKSNSKIVVKTELNRAKPEIESVSSLYKSAEWHERETYDLLGVNFINHSELKRILLPEDWIGHPLRKDYVMQDARLSWNDR